MQTVKNSVENERNRLEAAFIALEQAVESYAFRLQQTAEESVKTSSELHADTIRELKEQIENNAIAEQPAALPEVTSNAEVIGQIQQIVKSHETRIVELREEIGRLSVELIRIKDENRDLRDKNKQAAEIIGESITAIERLVAA